LASDRTCQEGEIEVEREGEDVYKDDNSDDAEVEDSRPTNSTNESRQSNCSIGSNRLGYHWHFFAIFFSNDKGVSEISSSKFKLPLAVRKALNFNFSYLVKISKDSWVPSIFELSGSWSSSSNKASAEFELEVKELHLSVNPGMRYLVYVQYRERE
jgi:hypothetical protein